MGGDSMDVGAMGEVVADAAAGGAAPEPAIADRLDRFFDELHRIDVALADYSRRLGVADSTAAVLDYLHDHDGASQRAIREYTMLPRQTVNNVIGAFAEQGYVRLEESERDRRVKTVWFTEEGRRYCNALIAPERAAEYRAMSGLDPALRDAMIRGMEIFGREFRRRLRDTKV